MMLRSFLITLLALVVPAVGDAAYSNYNSILIGERAAGMGGACTALYEDPAASPFYNPASISRYVGSTLSTSASVYHKYDVKYSDLGEFSEAPTRINQGTFKAIPTVGGNAHAFGLFALTFSVIFPDYDYFVGPVKAKDGNISHLSYLDESLWVGGALALNLSPQSSIGLSMYYTARDFSRSVFDQQVNGSNITTVNEEKSFTHNDLVYILGFYHQFNDNFSFGASYRLPSIEISGRGSYFKTTLTTSPVVDRRVVSYADLKSQTHIPTRFALGFAYRNLGRWTFSFDVASFGASSYEDIEHYEEADHIIHKPIVNYAFGAEYVANSWLRVRLGAYSNYSSHPEPTLSETRRQGDSIDMWGFSANFSIYTSQQTAFTFGGYYTGGRGVSTQLIGNQVTITPKSEQIFSMLIASSYFF